MDTREEWLNELTNKLRPMFAAIDFPLPEKIRASCGFPSKGALAKKKQRVGEAWSSDQSEDQHFETFVTPMISDPVEVAAIQVHELCHCAAGLECKHRKPFTIVARAVGLEGRMTATVAGEVLKEALEEFVEEIGPYPHAKLVYSSSPKKQGTRMIKVMCPELKCGYQVRTTKKWLEIGVPTCPCGETMVAEELKIELSEDRILLNGEDVTEAVRSSEVTVVTRHAADNPQVREHLVRLQRAVAGQDVVTEENSDGE